MTLMTPEQAYLTAREMGLLPDQPTPDQMERKRERDRAAARRKKAVTEGRNPKLVDGSPQPPVRITLLLTPVPSIPAARCKGQPELFFSADPEDITAAVFICQGCPGRAECLAGAHERGEVSGVWGGTDFDRDHQSEELAS